MHDFIRSQSFSTSRDPFGLVARPSVPEWLLRGIRRSFGEDDVVTSYRFSPRLPDQGNRKSKIQNRK